MMKQYLKQVLCTAARASFSLALALTAISPTITNADAPLSSYQATYNTRLGGVSVDIVRTLQVQADGKYQLNLQASAMLMGFNETSLFEANDVQIRPLKHSYQGSGLNRRKSSLAFDWSSSSARSFYKDNWYHLEILPGTHDRLSWQEQMRLELINKSLTDNNQVSMVSGKRIKHYKVKYIGEEQLSTPLGTLNTLHYSRSQAGSKREFHIWLAKDWDYLLLKIIQIESDKKPQEMIITKVTLGDKPLKGL